MKLRNQKVYTFEEIIPAKKKKLSAQDEFVHTTVTKKISAREEFIASYFRQKFSLPDSIIYYITKNPKSSKCYQMMIQSCKHFFLKNPILVIHCLQINDDGWKVCSGGTTCCTNKNVTMEKIKGCKIWIQNKIGVSSTKSSKIASNFISNIYQCDAVFSNFRNQRLSFEQFLLYSKNTKKCLLSQPLIYSETDSEIPFETIIANLPYLRQIYCVFHPSSKTVSKDTVANLLQIPHFKNITRFHLFGMSSEFDIDTFYDYYKKSRLVNCFIEYMKMPSPDYVEKLDAIVEEILAEKSRTAKTIVIMHPGQTMETRDALIGYKFCYFQI